MLYLAVQADQYELPIAVAESVNSLARMLKVSEMSIYAAIAKHYSGRNTGIKYLRIGEKEMNHYVYRELELKQPITQGEIQRIKDRINVGDRIKKKVVDYGFYTGKPGEKEKTYNCRVLEKCKYGVLVERTVRKGLYIKDFITYVDLARRARRWNGMK